jgi:hypothetical protein
MPLRRLTSTVAAAVAILSFTTAAQAQTDVVALLKSRDPRQQAWGTWYVGAGQVRQLVPLVQDVALEQLRVPGTSDLTLDVALDALIQLQSPVYAGLLPDLYAVRPAQALIIASFAGDDGDSFLRDVLHSSNGHEWFAAANLMLARRSSTLAPDLLSSLRLMVKIYLVDDGQMVGGGVGGGIGIGCGAVGRPAAGMPPIAAYTLDLVCPSWRHGPRDRPKANLLPAHRGARRSSSGPERHLY